MDATAGRVYRRGVKLPTDACPYACLHAGINAGINGGIDPLPPASSVVRTPADRLRAGGRR